MKERERVERGRRSDSREDDRKRYVEDANSSSSSILNGERSLNQIDELIATLKNGLDLKNPKTSDLLATYENKLAMIQIREQELERLVATKDAALQQSERLRIQYAASGGRASETEFGANSIACEDCEKLKEEKDKIEEEMERKRKENEAELEKKEKGLIDIRKEKKLLTREIESERDSVRHSERISMNSRQRWRRCLRWLCNCRSKLLLEMQRMKGRRTKYSRSTRKGKEEKR
ncbi:hypothetical protein PFISCL1PPCAC_28477 [Pristionchus fissidentatus]|uniref:Uncharacterized protein n=1 Tax=Pristionchus fissidentatus TaxID=1538716 RepID=A0AAV5X2K0_9BILA|nr:hypothetical protein PFISCL1PPCAC_28477 [Pristionchus fissidentatus]